MQRYKNRILYSASDLCHFIECAHLSRLDIDNLTRPADKTADSEEALLIQQKGHEHEARYLETLVSSGLSVVDIKQQVDAAMAGLPPAEHSQDRRNEVARDQTLQAMAQGFDIVYQATFLDDVLIGHADFLRRVNKPSRLGHYSYEVMDTKLSRTSKSKFVTQLVFYSTLLASAQGTDPVCMVVVLGDMSEAVYRYADYRFCVAHQLNRFLVFVKDAQAQQQTYPKPCQKCDQCGWRDRCKQQWQDDDHLCRVANMTSAQMEKLNAAGVQTMAQLAVHDARQRVPNMMLAVLDNLIKQAGLQKRGEREGRPVFELRPVVAGAKKGFASLPAPSVGDLYFDMEGDPLIPGGLEYLFGLWLFDNGQYRFKAFWAHNRAQEKIAFEAFMDFVIAHLTLHPDAHIYHYASYEETALKKLASLHGTRESQLDVLLRGQKLVDLYKVVKESIWVSEPGYSIKNIEHFYRGKREGDVQTAGASIVFYERWMQSGGEDKDLLRKIEDYNRDDVESTYGLHRWLLDIMKEAGIRSTATLAQAPASSSSSSSAAADFESRLATYLPVLLGCLPADEAAWSREQRVGALVFFLLGFFRRKMKPVWWAMFDRSDMQPHEWLDDPECLGEIQITHSSPVKNNKGVVNKIRHQCTFSPQQLKWTDLEHVLIYPPRIKATVEHFCTDTFTVTFTVKAEQEDQWPKQTGLFALGMDQQFIDEHLQPAVFRFADAWIARQNANQMRADDGTSAAASNVFPYQALLDFLMRELPTIRGVKKGAPIVGPNDDVSAMVQRILAMDNTCTVVQGPPGTGKTYTGSRMITAALAAGKTVGVCSNSHKAIHNLLDGVRKAAALQGLAICGAKKVTSGNEESHYVAQGFHNHADARDILLQMGPSGYQLIAGTAWLFARQEADQMLDYLFVDEAGQVSVANLIAMGVSARNIVLLGDQMQLAQPVQGVHPGESGLSGLDYLLRGYATVPPEMGIFLGVSYRMNPAVCDFISDTVYDGRLSSAPLAARRRLVLQTGAHEALVATGVRHVAVDHEGCSQHSAQEVVLVGHLLESLLQQQVDDGAGHVRAMSLDDVLVVAPYNVQVNALIKALPAGARVGTVDKLQGQEAEVVIVSMTTSSEDDLPRFMDFLYSKNRLNVAISRAKCVALFVANPKLMEISCSTPEQMALVNTVCRVGLC